MSTKSYDNACFCSSQAGSHRPALGSFQPKSRLRTATAGRGESAARPALPIRRSREHGAPSPSSRTPSRTLARTEARSRSAGGAARCARPGTAPGGRPRRLAPPRRAGSSPPPAEVRCRRADPSRTVPVVPSVGASSMLLRWR